MSGTKCRVAVTDDYPASGTTVSGEVHWVEIDLGKDAEDLDHLITPEERMRLGIGIQ